MPETNNDFGLIARLLSDGFNRIDNRLDELNRRLDNKADNTRVAALEAKHAEFEIEVNDRLEPLEKSAIGSAAVSTAHRRVVNFLGAIAASSVGALLYLIAQGHHL